MLFPSGGNALLRQRLSQLVARQRRFFHARPGVMQELSRGRSAWEQQHSSSS